MSKKIVAQNTAVLENTAPVKKGWRIKQYYINTEAYEAAKAELAKAPNQVQIMVNFFAKEFVGETSAAQGRVMCAACIERGGLRTVIEPHVLFAYYRKTMENFGLRLR